MMSEEEVREELADAKFWQAKEEPGSILDGMLKAKIDELEVVLGLLVLESRSLRQSPKCLNSVMPVMSQRRLSS